MVAARPTLSVAQLDELVQQLNGFKRNAEQAEGESNMELLLQFLQHSREDKFKKLKALEEELACLETDINKVENVSNVGVNTNYDDTTGAGVVNDGHDETGIFLSNGRTETPRTSSSHGRGQEGEDSYKSYNAMLQPATRAMQRAALLTAQRQSNANARLLDALPSVPADRMLAPNPGVAFPSFATQQLQHGSFLQSTRRGSDPQGVLHPQPESKGVDVSSGFSNSKKRRIAAQLEDLHSAYIRLRKFGKSKSFNESAADSEVFAYDQNDGEFSIQGQGQEDQQAGSAGVGAVVMDDGQQEFSRMLSVLTRFNKLQVIAEIPRPSLRQASSIISSVEFDRDGLLFATAGVSKRISVFEHASVVQATRGLPLVHCPVVEMVTRSKLSCLSWNRYIASHLASSDYEGVVTIWDVNTSSMVQEYEAHAKRIWSVDFCNSDPTLLASGSDDSTVKIWSTRSQSSLAQIDLRANVCAVKWRPGSPHELAVGCADHAVYTYDLRNLASPLATFQGHKKAVSYVRWSNEQELVTASTDSTLRLWKAMGGSSVAERVYEGHLNEKNFVGLAVDGDFLACGSETNEVFVYYKALSKPLARLSFNQGNGMDDLVQTGTAAGHNDADKAFVSAVCWRPERQELAVADSLGTVRMVVLTAAE